VHLQNKDDIEVGCSGATGAKTSGKFLWHRMAAAIAARLRGNAVGHQPLQPEYA